MVKSDETITVVKCSEALFVNVKVLTNKDLSQKFYRRYLCYLLL